MKHCTMDDCDGKVHSRGLCDRHYRRFLRHGDPSVIAHDRQDVTHKTVHNRLKRAFGRAAEYACACGKPAKDWCFDLPSGHSTDLSRYTPMCRACHVKSDGRLLKAQAARREGSLGQSIAWAA